MGGRGVTSRGGGRAITGEGSAAAIHIGTSGWTYADWRGSFYPENLDDAGRLSFYVRHFNTVEINATFYRLPFTGMITGWNRRLPEEFHLAVKGPRTVTHLKKLADCAEPLGRFLERVRELRTLRVILWQLPPSLRKDLDRLDGFLATLPRGPRHAVEFRHESWWAEETAALLRRHDAAFVAVSHPRLPADVLPTADSLYVRFHGLGRQLYSYDYSTKELAVWVERLQPLLEGRSLYAYFNNDWRAHAVRNAKTFRELLGRHPEPRSACHPEPRSRCHPERSEGSRRRDPSLRSG